MGVLSVINPVPYSSAASEKNSPRREERSRVNAQTAREAIPAVAYPQPRQTGDHAPTSCEIARELNPIAQ